MEEIIIVANQPKFWDKIARKYAAQPVANMEAYERTLARAREYLEPDFRAVEFGCGTGSTALKLAPHIAHYTATDFAPEMIAIGREKLEAAGELADKLEFACTTALQHSPAEPYDFALGLNYLHLLEKPERDIAAIYAMLCPGGVFISKSSCISGWRNLLRLVLVPAQLIGKAPFVKFFSPSKLEAMMKDAGFEILESEWLPEGSLNRFIVAKKPG